jgi:hypothetical protein
MKNPGKTYRPKGNPTRVNTHDFPDRERGKAVPYGVYDLAHNEAGVSVGISHDTADSGGSNSPRTRLWRWELQRLANRTGLIVEVCHYPPAGLSSPGNSLT